MNLVENIHEDMVSAMKQWLVDWLSTLCMVKLALKNKEIEQCSPGDRRSGTSGIDYHYQAGRVCTSLPRAGIALPGQFGAVRVIVTLTSPDSSTFTS